MYQMLTGVLPYDTPSPADLDRLMRGELLIAAAAQEPEDPEGDQRHRVKAMAPDIHARYQRAGDLLDDVLAARGAGAATRTPRRRRRRRRPRRRRRRRRTSTARLKAREDAAAALLLALPQAAPRPLAIAARSAAKRSSVWRSQLATANWSWRVLHQIANRVRIAKERSRWHFPGTGKIWMNGKLVEWKDAKIHIASHVIHYGSGVFEGARCYDDAERLGLLPARRAHAPPAATRPRSTGWSTRSTSRGWQNAVLDTIRANEMKACYIRPLVYRGYDALGVNPLPSPVDAAIMVWEWGAYLGAGSARAGRRREGQLVDAHGAEHAAGDGQERRPTTPTRR